MTSTIPATRKSIDYALIREPGSRVLREWNAQRQAAKTAQPSFNRAFAGGGVDRLTASWLPSNTSINVDLESQLPLLRSRSRSLWANTSFGRRFARLVETNVVGPTGFSLQATVKRIDGSLDTDVNSAIESAWKRWKKATTADIAGRLDFDSMCRLIIKHVAREGEALVRVVRGSRAGRWGFALQLLDPDRVDHSYNATLSNGNAVRMGVEIEPTGRIAAYHLLTAHPGDTREYLNARRERVLANDCWLLHTIERAEQLRGIPWMHAILLDSRNLAGFEEAAIIAARAGASKFAWLKQTDAAGTLGWLTETGAAAETAPTMGQITMSPKRISAYVEYSKQAIIQSAMALEPLLRQDLLDGLALEVDDKGINGSAASNQPRGLRNTSGVGAVIGGTNGATLAWSHVVGLETACANANAIETARSGYLVNTKIRGTAKTIQKAAGLPFIWENGAAPLNGYAAAVTNLVPSNLTKGTSSGVCSSIGYSSDWSLLVIGLFGAIDVVIDPFTLATTGMVRITVNHYIDVGCRQPGAFAFADDILTP